MKYGEHVLSSRGAFSGTTKANRSLVEDTLVSVGITFRMLGSEVTIVEAMDSVLPIFDKELRRPFEIAIKKQRLPFAVFAKGIEETRMEVLISFTPLKMKARS